MKEQRIKILKDMNDYIIELGDELLWSDWITLAVPDEASEDDYEFIAEEDNLFRDTCDIFAKLVAASCEDE